MLTFGHQQIYLYSQPIDMRKSINGLSYIVNDLPEQNPQDGSLILFYNRSRDKVKLLYWDNNGFVMVYKRLKKVVLKSVNMMLKRKQSRLMTSN